MRAQLRETSNVPRGHHGGARRDDGFGLFFTERGRGLRLIEVVGSGAAAADLGIGQLAKFHAGNATEQIARPAVGARAARPGMRARYF
jgi:hypothetical protein